MPVIHIDYNETADTESIRKLVDAIHTIVSEATAIEDVPVYARKAPIQSHTAPVEIFIEMSSHKIKDLDALTADIRERVKKWKAENAFDYPINLSLIPMSWKIEIGI